MKALVWHGKQDIRCDNVPDPEIEDPKDAIIKVTSCAICGSDLHLFHNYMPGMMPGDIVGHETMGEVVETGSAVSKLKKGDRIVIPFTINCDECDQCRRGNYSLCEKSNRNKAMADKLFGHAPAGLFGYTHLTGGYSGGQAEYLRVPYADSTHIPVPDSLTDEQVLFLSDIFPTGWQAAVQADIQPTDTVAIWGCGPVGQMAIRSAILLGAKQVVAIDYIPERLSMAAAAGAITINFDDESVVERLNELTQGKGPEKCIDCVGLEAHATQHLDSMMDRAKQAVWMESDRPHRPDPREPLDGRPPAAHPGEPDRPVVRHHPSRVARRGPAHVQDVPRQGRRLHQGRRPSGPLGGNHGQEGKRGRAGAWAGMVQPGAGGGGGAGAGHAGKVLGHARAGEDAARVRAPGDRERRGNPHLPEPERLDVGAGGR